MQSLTRSISEPYESNLSELLIRAWEQIVPGRLWVMPASHWAFELDFGSREWMPEVLKQIGIDSRVLQDKTDGSAIEFTLPEKSKAGRFVLRLIEKLSGSDFYIVFPDHRVVILLHHHKQIWWTSASVELIEGLDRLTQ